MEISQFQIALVNLNPSVGYEIKKTRPCVIVSPDEMNRHLKTVIIAPMTTTSKPYPTRVLVKNRQKKGWAVLDQIRTVDRTRIVRTYGQLTDKEIVQIKKIMKEMFVD
jgi:mRNA interferase MazF